MTETSGVFIVDKPAGMTSAGLTNILKRLLKVKKIGHSGTLDPFATGVMVCCTGQATRLSRFFLAGTKSYEAVMVLGVATDTQDATGTVTAVSGETNFPEEVVSEVLARFMGESLQAPPVYSALKHEGVPLYRLAREGRPVQKPARPIHISEIRLIDMNLPEVRFQVTCSAGTYIRTLCTDMGTLLGCGAHLKELRRTEACGFGIGEAVSLEALQELAEEGRAFERMISMSDALKGLPEVVATPAVAEKIRYGRPVLKTDLGVDLRNGERYIKIVDRDRCLIAVLTMDEDKSAYDYGCVMGPER